MLTAPFVAVVPVACPMARSWTGSIRPRRGCSARPRWPVGAHHCRRGPWRSVSDAHAVHQFAQVRSPVSRELITGVSQVMKVDHWEPGRPQSRMSVAAAEVTTQASGVPTLRPGSAASWTGSRSTTGVFPGSHLQVRQCDSSRSPRRVHQVVRLQLGKATRHPRLVRV